MRGEDRIQANVIKWSQQPTVRKAYPCLKMLYHIPNERQCTPQQGRLLKMLGVKPGVPDLCLPVPCGKFHGLYIELKTENGKPSPAQEWWRAELRAEGYAAAICYGFDAAVTTIVRYLDGDYQ